MSQLYVLTYDNDDPEHAGTVYPAIFRHYKDAKTTAFKLAKKFKNEASDDMQDNITIDQAENENDEIESLTVCDYDAEFYFGHVDIHKINVDHDIKEAYIVGIAKDISDFDQSTKMHPIIYPAIFPFYENARNTAMIIGRYYYAFAKSFYNHGVTSNVKQSLMNSEIESITINLSCNVLMHLTIRHCVVK